MMKVILPIVGVVSALVTVPQCNAFTISPLAQSTRAHSIHTPLQAFKFPSFGAEEEEESYAPIEDDEFGLQSAGILDPISDVLFLALRIGTCSLMIHHGFDKVINVEGFSANVVAKFFGFLPGPPQFWTLSAAGTQIAGSGLLALGILARPVAFSMMMTMLVAVVFHLLNTGGEGYPFTVVSQHSYNYELAAMYVGVLAYFAAEGAGKFSVDEAILGGELNFYQSAFDKVFGGNDEE